MLEALIWLVGAFVVGGIAVFRGWRRSQGSIKRTSRNMWDSQVQSWVSEGIRRGYVMNAGYHTAHDGRTKVQTLVVQSSAVKRLHQLEEETHEH